MVKLTYLSAVFLAIAMNLAPTYAIPLADGEVEASPANSTLTPNTKDGPIGLASLLPTVGAIVNGFRSDGLEQVHLLRPFLCERLTATTAEYTWKKNPNQKGKNYSMSFDLKSRMLASSRGMDIDKKK